MDTDPSRSFEAGRSVSHGQLVPIGYRMLIDESEAAVVRQIFQLYRKGLAEKAIAKRLNTQVTGRSWRPNTIYLMLQNSKYIGHLYFNRRDWRKHPETGRRVYRWRPRDQWESRVSESLRIIDEETWEAVQVSVTYTATVIHSPAIGHCAPAFGSPHL